LLARRPRPTGLLCLSDRLAEGAIQAATDAGLQIPADLSLVGFDDAGRLAADLGLTTVRQPHRDKGEQAARALIAQLNGEEIPAHQVLPTELVDRGSVSAV
jgi:DNA-binding LacI/PurR family transcriptional regulator